MCFSVISKEEAVFKYKTAENKIEAIKVIADLTASTKEDVVRFLGVTLIKKKPYVL